jgi:hypothetical protein
LGGMIVLERGESIRVECLLVSGGFLLVKY